MIRIEFKTDTVHEKRGIAKASGNPFIIREQDAWAHLCDRNGQVEPFPTKITVNLENDQPPYQVGSYTLLPQSIYVTQDYGKGALRIGRLQLRQIVADAKKQAA